MSKTYNVANFNAEVFISNLSQTQKDNMVGLKHSGTTLEIWFQDGVSQTDMDSFDANVSGHDHTASPALDPLALRVYSVLNDTKTDDEIKRIDITLLGLTQEAWDYSRGARTTRDYKDDSDNLVVQHVYSYTYTNGNRDLATVSHTFDWYRNDGTVGLSKTINKIMTTKSLGMLNREVRIGRMTDLRENAKAIGRQDIVDNLYSWYGSDILDYEDTGSIAFENAINTEADVTRRATLDESIAQFGGLTVEQLLIWQFIGAYSWT